jgi:hypothetical protein
VSTYRVQCLYQCFARFDDLDCDFEKEKKKAKELYARFVILLSCFLQVAVAPGGRWSRFKTYSTIQRTLEIWGFVIQFIFKSWLNRQKFSYKGLLFIIRRL